MKSIRIELDPMEYLTGSDGTTLGDELLNRAADQLLKQSMDWDAKAEVSRRIREIRDEEIRSAITPLIEESIASVVQQTDGFGTPKGEPKPLRTLLMEADHSQLMTEGRG